MSESNPPRKSFLKRILVPRLSRFCTIYEEKRARYFHGMLAQEETMELMKQDRLAELRANREGVAP